MNKKRSLFFDTSLIYFVVIALFVVLRIATSVIPTNTLGSSILSIVIQVGFMLVVPFLMYKIIRRKKTKEVMHDFNVKKIGFKAILFAIGIGVVIYFLNIAVASFFNMFIMQTGYDPSFGMATAGAGEYSLISFIGDIILSALLPGICEEFCHRGLLVNGYKQIGAKRTIILVGVLFGLMHLNIEQVFYAIIIGMFLTYLVYITGSIIPSMIVHFLNNAIGLYITFASYNNLPLGNFSEVLSNALTGNAFTVIGTIILIVLVLLGLLAFFTFMLLKNTRVKEFASLAKKAIESKQRENILKSFDLNVEELNKEQGIRNEEPKDLEVVVSDEFVRGGRKNVLVDFNFSEDSLMNNVQTKPSLKDKAFLYGIIFIGVFITISTLIWGIL